MAEGKSGGVVEDILKGIGEAVTDIRHKVVEEGYFGRQVTPDTQERSPYADLGLPATFEEYRAAKEPPAQEQAKAQEVEKDRDIGE